MAKENLIEIEFENHLFGERMFDVYRQQQFGELTPEGPLEGRKKLRTTCMVMVLLPWLCLPIRTRLITTRAIPQKAARENPHHRQIKDTGQHRNHSAPRERAEDQTAAMARICLARRRLR